MKQPIFNIIIVLALALSSLPFAVSVNAAGAEEVTPTQPPSTTKGGVPIYGAPVYGEPVYGGGVIVERGAVLVDKKVQNPATGEFVDHLSVTDPKYRPKEIIIFKLKVSNPSDTTLSQVVVKDTFPKLNGQVAVDFMEGPGIYDTSSNTLNFTVADLSPNTSQEFTVKGRVVHPALLVKDKNIICPDPGNVVEAHADKLYDRDEAKFCIVREFEKEVPEVPEAGPAEWFISLAGLATAFVAGQFLRKKSIIG